MSLNEGKLNEYKTSIHFKNAYGVRAQCRDCHIPEKQPNRIHESENGWYRRYSTANSLVKILMIPPRSSKRTVYVWRKMFGK
ncbi:NapC/NirT family cytochrome c [Photobacterium leiognathi]|uniref:NapC/NirT family cytochrome c n=1 Tax=Photobacterium leiognathi TaxID=553611 RepID=UPI0027370946|nr:NapC/NirT family cytochrome c [Photobacterium leiognathi]